MLVSGERLSSDITAARAISAERLWITSDKPRANSRSALTVSGKIRAVSEVISTDRPRSVLRSSEFHRIPRRRVPTRKRVRAGKRRTRREGDKGAENGGRITEEKGRRSGGGDAESGEGRRVRAGSRSVGTRHFGIMQRSSFSGPYSYATRRVAPAFSSRPSRPPRRRLRPRVRPRRRRSCCYAVSVSRANVSLV